MAQGVVTQAEYATCAGRSWRAADVRKGHTCGDARCSGLCGEECDGKTRDDVRRRGCDSLADSMVGMAAGTGAGGDLGRARQLYEGTYGTGSPHDLAGLQSEGTGAGGRGAEDGEAEEVRR